MCVLSFSVDNLLSGAFSKYYFTLTYFLSNIGQSSANTSFYNHKQIKCFFTSATFLKVIPPMAEIIGDYQPTLLMGILYPFILVLCPLQ